MDECPTIPELAAAFESKEAVSSLTRHVEDCEACQETLQMLQTEVQWLQVSISEMWFRERVSCPDRDSLERHARGTLPPGEAEYVRFHLETLGCPFCVPVPPTEDAEADTETRKSRARSRKKLRKPPKE